MIRPCVASSCARPDGQSAGVRQQQADVLSDRLVGIELELALGRVVHPLDDAGRRRSSRSHRRRNRPRPDSARSGGRAARPRAGSLGDVVDLHQAIGPGRRSSGAGPGCCAAAGRPSRSRSGSSDGCSAWLRKPELPNSSASETAASEGGRARAREHLVDGAGRARLRRRFPMSARSSSFHSTIRRCESTTMMPASITSRALAKSSDESGCGRLHDPAPFGDRVEKLASRGSLSVSNDGRSISSAR